MKFLKIQTSAKPRPMALTVTTGYAYLSIGDGPILDVTESEGPLCWVCYLSGEGRVVKMSAVDLLAAMGAEVVDRDA
ncbi:MAG TPA: hypothetical protein VIY27_04030 [Myxococcota bacterium]